MPVITSVKSILRRQKEPFLIGAIKSAIREQGLHKLFVKLSDIVPDIRYQYSNFVLDTPYLDINVRAIHAFQMSLVNNVIEQIEDPVIVDIGDSAGTHLQYILGIYSDKKKIKCLSVNMDKQAVERIKLKGLDAVCGKAEDLMLYDIRANVFLCFETLEHLMNPCFFLHELSTKTNAEYLILTVPYIKTSRVGLHHIRGARKDDVNAENTHIFELCPEDWKLLAQHSGWKIAHENIYFQYPKYGLFRISQLLWKRFDFEGFYGLVLQKDDTWSIKYSDW